MNKKLFDAIKEADAVVIGPGAGLSTSGGLECGGDRFNEFRQEVSHL